MRRRSDCNCMWCRQLAMLAGVTNVYFGLIQLRGLSGYPYQDVLIERSETRQSRLYTKFSPLKTSENVENN